MPKKHVFISYCSENRPEVRRLRGDLRKENEPVWWDQDILPAQDWRLAVRQALDESYAVIFCFSKESEARYKSGIYPELSVAIDRFLEYAPGGLFLFPVKLSPCEVPLVQLGGVRMLRDIQHVELFPPSEWDEGVKRLATALRMAPEHP